MDAVSLLIVAATEAECAPALRKMDNCKSLSPWLYSGTMQGNPVEILISGVGVAATAFRLTHTLMQGAYDRAVSIGIAGCFTDIAMGEVVQITEDCFADLGIDDNGSFLNLRDAGLAAASDDFAGIIANPSPAAFRPTVRGITVQTASGSQKRIDELAGRHHPQVETMENAAFFYVCRMMHVPFASFRGISNRVEPRNRENWRITEAIENVNSVVTL